MAGRAGWAGRRARTAALIATACVVVLAAVAGGIAFTRSGGSASRASGLAVPSFPARLADGDFPPSPAGPASFLLPSLGAVTVAGQVVVAAGTQASLPSARPVILVSADGGHLWQRAVLRVTAGDQGLPPPTPRAAAGALRPASAVPVMAAGGRGRWLVLGPGFAWLSLDARTWRAVPGVTPLAAGDRVIALARTSGGFIAVGENVSGRGVKTSRAPVLWVSGDGLTWQRLDAARLNLAAAGRQVVKLRWVASRGHSIVIAGETEARAARRAHKGAARQTGRRGTRVIRSLALWRSTDAGMTWARVTLPAGHGAARGLAGLATTRAGFVAIRPGRTLTGRRDGVAYVSSQGARWRFSGRLTAARHAALRVNAVAGDWHGMVAAGSAGVHRVAFRSLNGRTWRQTADLGRSQARTVAAVAAGPHGLVVAAGSSQGRASQGQASQGQPLVPVNPRPFLLLAGSRLLPVGGGALAGEARPNVAVTSLAASAGEQVAAGRADGAPALWWASGAGRWSPAAVSLPGSWNGGGAGLTGVAHGRSGWLAVGHTGLASLPRAPGSAADHARGGGPASVPAAHLPMLMTSADGRTWRPAAGTGPVAVAGARVTRAAAGPSGYVVVGSQWTHGRRVAAAWFSPDLGGWARAGDAGAGDLDGPGYSRQMLAVTAARAGFVAAGNVGSAPAVWTSPDGAAWRLTSLPVPAGASSAVLTQVAALGSRVVAMGTRFTGASSRPLAVVSSDSGLSWRETTPTAPAGPAAVTALTAAGGVFAAGGISGPPGSQHVVVWWSTDGVSWHLTPPRATLLRGPGTHQIAALGAFGRVLFGVGYTATLTGQHPVLWRARLH